MKEEEVRGFIKIIFEQYQKMKHNHILYNDNDEIPQSIIMLYYKYINTSSFESIIREFKKKYIHHETILEEATAQELEGLGVMYDFIRDYDCSKKFNLYILLKLHQLIYSKCNFPSFGGTFRNDDVYLPNTGVMIPEHDYVPIYMAQLYPKIEKLLNETEARKKDDSFDVIDYINQAINIKCRLIEIHPFYNGNGRSSRGFLNLLFKFVGLPPVYVEQNEKIAYNAAMNKAIVKKDFSDIYKFYYYKICDSIYELDVKAREREEELQKEESSLKI